ncbi:unnamed protein product, partial [Brenthis ino]
MPSDKECCIPGCKETKVLHGFPNPEKDIQRFNMWFNAIGGDLVGMDNKSIFKYRRVCHTHFELKYKCRYDRISKNAVPTLNMPGGPCTLNREPLQQIQDQLQSLQITSSNICCACLSVDRKLTPLCNVEDGVNNLFCLVSCDSEAYEVLCGKGTDDLHICWECKALMHRLSKFRDQACLAQKKLYGTINEIQCLSQLSTYFQSDYNDCITNEDTADYIEAIENATDNEQLEYIESDCDTEFILSNIESEVDKLDEEIEKDKIDTIEEIPDPDDLINEIIIDNNVNFTTIKMTKMEMLESLEQRKCVESFLEAEFKCEWCVEVYKDEMERHVHISEAHAKKPNHIKCDICTTYVRKRWFPEHRRDHYLKFHCHLCDFVAYNLLVILRHLKIGHAVWNMRGQMKKLRKRLYLKSPGLRPWEADVAPDARSTLGYKCSKCDEVFPTRNKRTLHMQRSHNDRNKCSICGKIFAGSYNLKNHEHIHKGTMPKQICPICGKSIRRDTMKYHMKVHSQREAAVCAPCGKTFVSDFGYQRHLRFSGQHGDALRIRCPICLKGFTTNMDRRDHVNYTHRGITIHKCSICDKVMSSERLLKRHLRFAHLGEKKVVHRRTYLCPVCGHVCRDSTALREHESLHTGIKTFTCELCDKKFRTCSTLYGHKRAVHRVVRKPKLLKHIEMDSGGAEE